jgi:hypothetical protein
MNVFVSFVFDIEGVFSALRFVSTNNTDSERLRTQQQRLCCKKASRIPAKVLWV